jgi:hypothetical protein
MAEDADNSHFRLPLGECRKDYFGGIGGFSSEAYQAIGFSRDRSTSAPQVYLARTAAILFHVFFCNSKPALPTSLFPLTEQLHLV